VTRDEAVKRLKNAGVDNPRLDARLLWEHADRIQKSALVAYDRRDAIFDGLVARRAAREPLAYITGHKEFWSLDFAVGPGCLIPRPETEIIIEQAKKLYPDRAAPLAVLDLGTGSGCLLIATLTAYRNARGIGIDLSPDALVWAERNIGAHKLDARASLIETEWVEEASPGFDLVLSNPPYIPAAEIDNLQPEISIYEPRVALEAGVDGLDAYRALTARIARLLKPSGHALLEIGAGQAEAVSLLAVRANLQLIDVVADLAGIPRVLVLKRNN
jgi:release factor glutamine methyltransferase